jgi:hypothetical protein
VALVAVVELAIPLRSGRELLDKVIMVELERLAVVPQLLQVVAVVEQLLLVEMVLPAQLQQEILAALEAQEMHLLGL